MLDNDTKKRIDAARDTLVGKVPDPKSQVEQITMALVYKFMDDMDRESVSMDGNPSFFTGDFQRYAWSKIFDPRLGGFEMLTLYSEALIKLNQNPNIPQLFRDIFKNAYLPYRDPETLKIFLKIINEFSYDHSERLGDAFEYLLSVLGSQGDAGQFRTPRHIIDFMVQVINPQKHEVILDPACGTAGFLISSYKHIMLQNTKKVPGDLLTPDDRKTMLMNFKGYDISPDMVRLSLVNLYLHGFAQPQIYEYDTLTSEERWSDYADVILANPPFMSPKGGIRPHKKFTVQSNRSEVLFVDYIAEHLTPTGRAAVIVPEGIIFQSANAYKDLRKMLIDTCLYAVVSLPAGIFNPYSGVKTSILLMDKQVSRKTDSILFIKIDNDGYGLGAQRREIEKNDMPEALQTAKEYLKAVNSGSVDSFKPEDKIGSTLLIKKDIIRENDFNLTGDRYKITAVRGNHKWPMVKLGDICDVRDGTHDSPKYVQSDGYPLITSKNIKNGYIDFTDINLISKEDLDKINVRSYVDDGDIIMPMIGTIGNPIIVNKKSEFAIKNVALIKFSQNSKVLNQYVKFLLDSDIFSCYLRQQSSGATQKFISLGFIRGIEIPLPPIEVQKEIVAEIEGYQKIIDGAKQVVDNWKPKIDIDPEWPMVKLGEVCDVRDGTHDSPKYVQTDGYPLITSKNIKNGFIDFTDVNLISKEDLDKINERSYVDNGDIIMPMIGTIGNPIIVIKQREFAIKNVALIKFSKNSIVLNKFMKSLLDSDAFYHYFQQQSSGATQKFISLNFIRNLEIPIPDISVQYEIVQAIESERNLVIGFQEIIKMFESKINFVINRIWEGK